ncbi:ABC transporter permease [Actinomyces gerencseriae]|jgi:ABC-2 type transporter|uniref:ABC transporter permease n=1 Tax=Actinomyces gerencseriae TaxID=52769 RepID=UPI000478D150|nr:ABC transporter permease [Actinomyces gerencseriae]
MTNVLRGAVLTAEFEIKAADLLTPGGFARLIAEPVFYSAFVVTALSSRGGGVDVDLVGFLTIGVIGIQYVRMMTQVIYRWTLERKWSLGGLKLSSGVPRLGYYAGGGMLLCGLFWSALGCVLTAIIRSYRTRDFVVAMMLTPLMFSAPTLYSLDQVPVFLRAVARLNPLTYQLHFLRSAANGEWVTSGLLVVLSLTLIMVCIGYVSTGRMRTVSNDG